ncbi:MAG: PTS sugar transporter subunit IIA [Candidatus Eisenbacteria bacterium]|nr:PTS sugar transporter subunit IIA [Candidatus Eisenbacteria bacterium]MCC7143993.1 PTS sugar transporter subunit IIA [Candidatus Eisenbacteria bacterium]
MSLTELIQRDCIQLDVPAADKAELIRAMVERLRSAGVVTDPDAVLKALLERERVMSTGIGGGVAIPHAQSPAVQRLAVSLARPHGEIAFESLDEKPVRLVFMIVGPEERGGFIRILARISRLLYTGDLQKRILLATSPDQVQAIIAEEEEKLRQ